jgi:hypothetical protein
MRRDAWLEKQEVRVLQTLTSQLTHEIDEAADAIVRLASEAP